MSKLQWAKLMMLLAAIYNAVWGAIISIYPQIILFDYPSGDFTLILLRSACSWVLTDWLTTLRPKIPYDIGR